jgi:hypothetical protein
MTEHTERTVHTAPGRRLLALVAAGVGLVWLAPFALSAFDLFSWATSDRGLGLPDEIGYAVFIGLDVAAVVCIAMKIVKSYRGEGGGVFSVLAWVFVAGSAFAQFSHGRELLAAGGPRDVWWAMPAFAVLGPVLLDVVLHQIRKWQHVDSGTAVSPWRWLPGIAWRESWAAWRAKHRVGLRTMREAVDYVRDLEAVSDLTAAEALAYALAELETEDTHAARKWLQRRGVRVAQADIDAVEERRAAQAAQLTAMRKVRLGAQKPAQPRSAQPRTAHPAQPIAIAPARRTRDVAAQDQRAAALRDGAGLVRAGTHSIRAAAKEVGLAESSLREHIKKGSAAAPTVEPAVSAA